MIDSPFRKLTLSQAVGQKLMLSFTGLEPSQELIDTLRRQHIAGVTLFRALNVHDPAQVRRLTGELQRLAEQAGQPPLLIAVDQEGGQFLAVDGGTTRFPGNLALGATGSTDLTFWAGYALGRELAAMGINVNYAPCCDVNSNPRNPVIGSRSFGEDSRQVGRLCAAMVRGLQAAGIAATAKHFPGHGDTEGDTHHELAVLWHDSERVRKVELPPFRAAIEAGVRLVMTAHVAYPALDGGRLLPATLSPELLRGQLRGTLGFGGVIISDALEMAGFGQADPAGGALASSLAGVDLLLLNHDRHVQRAVYTRLIQAARSAQLPPDAVLRSAGRILSLKQHLGVLPQPPFEVVGSAEHREIAAEIAARSITLLRDERGLLPLRLAPDERIAVVVPEPADLTPADTSSYIRCELAEALRRQHGAVDEYVVPLRPAAGDITAVSRAVAGHAVVVAGTINAYAEPAQAELVRTLLRGPAPVLVAAMRMPYDLACFPEAPAFACTYSILPPSMEALAQALLGRLPFAGRLPVSIPGLYGVGHGLE